GIREGERLLIVNPFFHVFGYTGGWVLGLLAGGTVYPLPVFDVGQVLAMIESEQITYFPGPPTIFHSILEDERLDQTDVTSLRASLTGSADVPVDLIQAMLDRLTFERVVQAYGMTECGTATNTIAADSAEIVATTVGKASKDLEVAVVDPSNEPVPIGEPGEIVVRGYAVMDGYFDDPDATAETIDADGWLHTGDRGSEDEDGYFRILGRIKDMLIVGGFNVYPAEVEDMIREHPDVEDVALIGVPDARLGEVGCAYVVPRQPIELDEFVAWCRERMANFKVPRYLEPIDAFPLTGSNKVSKVDLRELAAKQQIGEVREP
ncbi:MAG: AMP-binding protein, partial [Actinomycetota bacterium]|nr:AMP-binding protein [Actinomycetota bacterium]